MANERLRHRLAWRGPVVAAPVVAPTITSFGASDTTLVEGDTMDTTWTLSGGTPDTQIIDWGDGSGLTTVSVGTTMASHDFDIAGSYTATLTVENSGGDDSETITGIEVEEAAPPSGISFKTWPAFTSITETRRNLSGGTVSNAPVKFLAKFHKGSLPTTLTLQLRDDNGDIVPTTDWQWGERVTHVDGSLMSCIVRCYGPASWANGTDLTWTLEAVSGSWPAETDSKTVSDVTGGSDININLTGVRRFGPNTSDNLEVETTQDDHTYTTLTGSVNYALGLTSRVEKRTGGAISTQWYTWAKFRNGSNNDAFLWWKGWIEVWYAPGTSTIRAITFHPIINNGWGQQTLSSHSGRALAFKCSVTDGGSTILDYTHTLSITSSNIISRNGNLCFDYNIDNSTHPFQPGTFAYIASGTPPTGVTVGKLHNVIAVNEGFGVQDPWRDETAGHMGLCPVSKPSTNVAIVHPGGGGLGGSWTMESWMLSCQQHPLFLWDRTGRPLAVVGSYPHIAPNWSRAEKLARMETGQIPSLALDNTTAGPGMSDRPYHPGGRSLHRQSGDAPGGFFNLGRHIGEVGTWTWDVIQDMTVVQSHKTIIRAAAEIIGVYHHSGYYDATTNPSTSAEYAELIDPTNGSDGAGTAHTGCGAPMPYYGRPNFGRSGAAFLGYTQVGTVREDRAVMGSGGGIDGTHTSQVMGHAFSLYPEPMYREGCAMQALGVLVEVTTHYHYDHTSQSDPDIALLGVNKKFDGVRYWRSLMFGPGIVTGGFLKRTPAGFGRALSFALYNPDNTPVGRWVKTLAKNQLDFGKAFWNSDRMGDGAKIVGNMAVTEGWGTGTYSSSGNVQHWMQTRVAAAALYLMKNTGIEYPECLQWCTATSRMLLADAIGGQNIPGYSVNHMGFGFSLQYYDLASAAANTLTDTRCTFTRFDDDAMSIPDARSVRLSGAGVLYFETDGETVTLTSFGSLATDHPTIAPGNGSSVHLQSGNYVASTLLSPLQFSTTYYLYDRSGTSYPYTYKLSSTPGPSYTQVTWTTATRYRLGNSDDNTAALCAGFQPSFTGPFTNGRFFRETYASDYVLNNATPAVTAAVMFGSEAECDTASANYDALWADLWTDQSYRQGDALDAGGTGSVYAAFNYIVKNPP